MASQGHHLQSTIFFIYLFLIEYLGMGLTEQKESTFY